MKKLLLILAAVWLCTAFSSPASAQSARFTFNPIGSVSNVAPGSTIQFSILLNVTTGGQLTDVIGLTFFLEQTTPVNTYPLAIVAFDRTGSPFSTGFFNPVFPDHLFPRNSRDLGALIPEGAPPLGTGSYLVGTISLQIAANALPQTYTVQSTTTGSPRSIVIDSTGFVSFPITPGSINIRVVPEPGTISLLACGGLAAMGAVAAGRRSRGSN